MNMLTNLTAEDQAGTVSPRRWRRTTMAAIPVVLLGGAWLAFHRDTPAQAAPPPPTLTVAQPLQREVAEWDDYVGRFEPSRSVEVRPRVSGQVTSIHFTDGAIVQKGQLLFTIDPRPFAASLAEARARLASAQSDLALAQNNLDRANRLVADDAVSKSDLDALGARVRAANAAVAAAQAQVRARALDVEFTQVRAPIGGRVSDRRVDAGNLVAAGEGSGGSLLTTINALDPIYFAFNGSEGLFLKTKRAQAAGKATSPVRIRLQDEGDYRWQGRLDFTDNGLDPHSGTIRGRAVLANPGLFLTPGMFGNMRLASGGAQPALLIPDSAVQTDQARKTVLVVGTDNKVQVKPVELGPLIDGLRIVRSGLARTDRVVISGAQAAMPGFTVQTRPGQIAAAPETATAVASSPASSAATFALR
jgi:RND family efflux transporter MFP subunit